MGNYFNGSPKSVKFMYNCRERELFPGEPFQVPAEQDYLLDERHRQFGIVPFSKSAKLDDLFNEGLGLFKSYVEKHIIEYKQKTDTLRKDNERRPVRLSTEEEEYLALYRKIIAGEKAKKFGYALFKYVYPKPLIANRVTDDIHTAYQSISEQLEEKETVKAG